MGPIDLQNGELEKRVVNKKEKGERELGRRWREKKYKEGERDKERERERERERETI